jgi:hypothetical protein
MIINEFTNFKNNKGLIFAVYPAIFASLKKAGMTASAKVKIQASFS